MLTERHAYLIVAHERADALAKLVAELDDGRNDIFVHIDRKAPFDGRELRCRQSRLTVLPERIDGRWGDYSLVAIEFALLRAATASGRYARYHLLSGVDMPVKTQDEIHEDCSRLADREFIAIAQNTKPGETAWRSQHRFLFSKRFQSRNPLIKAMRRGWAMAQSAVGYRRYRGDVVKGSQWWSITDAFARYALSREAEMLRHFKGTYCPDEMVFQTICRGSEFWGKLYSTEDEFEGNRRWIRWEEGQLMPLTPAMIAEARLSDRWFARKRPAENVIL